MTLAEIRTLVRQFISETDSGNSTFSDTELNGYINMATRWTGALMKYPRRSSDELTPITGQSTYSLASDVVIIRNAYFGNTSTGEIIPLNIVTEETLKEIAPNWMSTATKDQGKPVYIILKTRNSVMVYPSPASTEITGNSIKLSVVYQPAVLVADGDIPDLPIVYHDLIPEYANHLCCMGKLKEYDKGLAILKTLMDKSKQVENLVLKDSISSLGFTFGNSIGGDDEWGGYANS